MLVDERYVVQAPGGMSFVEASTLFTAGVTAWNALCYGNEEGNGVEFLKGKTVLTQGTGGVSCYAIQVSFSFFFFLGTTINPEETYSVFEWVLVVQNSQLGPQIASAAGATVIATSSSSAKLETARKLGAKHTINYRSTPDWSTEALKLTSGAGVDIVVDVAGGADLLHSVNSLRYGGRVALVGVLNKEDAPVSLTQPLLYGGKSSKFFFFALPYIVVFNTLVCVCLSRMMIRMHFACADGLCV
jgi:NADPH:quinone reductase-like Zn-dependent oxidoreductase